MKTVEELIEIAKERNASDLHLIYGLPPKMRIDGILENVGEEALSYEDCIEVARYLSKEQFDKLMSEGEYDGSDTFNGQRCRIHLFKQQGVPSLALRLLQNHIPTLDTLGLPPVVEDLCDLHKGIVLVTGETGSGKSTTLAAMVDRINHKYKSHIVTLEDPIEYIHTPALCAINQREVGKDTKSFAEGLRASLREDPNVILIGEMRDKDTIETAITAAETGHLVFATLHSATASDSIDRIVQVFSADMQDQIRLQLSTTLEAVISQQLLKREGGGRVLACELMLVNDAIRNNIRTKNNSSMRDAIRASASNGGQLMDQALENLYRQRLISFDTLLHYAKDKDKYKRGFF